MISAQPVPAAAMQAASPMAHVHNTFHFTVPLDLAHAAPLFGPEGEKNWAGTEWSPQFLYPTPARDTQGAVFTIRHGEHDSLWVNTVFDLAAGHMQYVAVVPGVMVSVVEVVLHPGAGGSTQVAVTYDRTALHPSANAQVEELGHHDQQRSSEWQSAIQAAIGK